MLKEYVVSKVDSHFFNKELVLSSGQESEIISSQSQVKNGFSVAHEALNDEINKWLKE